jgi:hypothetical protein
MNREEMLADVAADLVSIKQNRDFVRRLFRTEAGRWASVPTLCEGLPETAQRLKELEALAEGELLATWLDFPISLHGSGYCLIIFYLEELNWSNVAIFNKRVFS